MTTKVIAKCELCKTDKENYHQHKHIAISISVMRSITLFCWKIIHIVTIDLVRKKISVHEGISHKTLEAECLPKYQSWIKSPEK